jgi:hypothetical protein
MTTLTDVSHVGSDIAGTGSCLTGMGTNLSGKTLVAANVQGVVWAIRAYGAGYEVEVMPIKPVAYPSQFQGKSGGYQYKFLTQTQLQLGQAVTFDVYVYDSGTRMMVNAQNIRV